MNLAEILVILIVALLVLGPKQLPMVATHIGKLIKKINRFKMQLSQFWQQFFLQQQLEENKKKAEQADIIYQSKIPDETK